MRTSAFKSLLIRTGLAASVLLLASGAAFAQQQINLSAGPATATLPDGSLVPMWGYSCGAVVPSSTATCTPLNPAAATTAGAWSPVVITVPTGQGLTINLTNNLSFMPPGGTIANAVPTSLVIVGQLGGGLGDVAQRTVTAPPDHSNAQAPSWPITNATTPVGVGTPPTQGPRVQSFSTEVAAGATAALTWSNLKPGTYLIESGTHPSIQGPMGLYGILVVTTVPAGATAGTAYPPVGATAAVTYNTEVPLLMSEIDPAQNGAVQAAVGTLGFSETMVWSGLPGGCGNPSSTTYQQCYPPTVNYGPLYYLFNGVAFDKTNASHSLFAAAPGTSTAPVTGSVLVRLVNAGLRMHVPSIVGSQTGTAAGLSLIAEDGNVLPGVPRVQSEVFMAAGKTYDVMVNVPAAGASALPIYDRELSLSANAVGRDGGMLAYVGVNGAGLPAGAAGTPFAQNDSYSVVPGRALTVSDPAKGVIANDTNVYGVTLLAPPTNGTVKLARNGTFTYSPSSTATPDSFTYCANGTVTAGACSSGVTATVTLGAAPIEAASGITCAGQTFSSTIATYVAVAPPGVLAACKDALGYPLTVDTTTIAATGATVVADANGGFTATATVAGSSASFTFMAKNSQGTLSASAATVTINFLAATGLQVTVQDGTSGAPIGDYRWIIEEDRTFLIDPKCTTNPPPAGCPTSAGGIVPTFGTNFHTSYMPLVATGCTGILSCESGQTLLGAPAVCDVGNGVCRTTASQQMAIAPSQVHLDPTKRYYISVLPGDAANPFGAAYLGPPDCSATGVAAGHCGHGMGGAPIGAGQTAVTVLAQPTPFQPAKLTVSVFEDDFPLNGEQDPGGGVDVLAPNEPGLGGFNITLFDDAGGTGDPTGQMTYDMFNQPLSNSLAGTIDPLTGKDACPISKNARIGVNDPTQTGITGTIVTCPKYEADGQTLSPLAGQAVVANLMPGRYGVVATPGADRIARGEEWLQTNTLDGQKAHDSFLRIAEPSFFQEFGPAGFHVSIGFANPAIINARKASVCNGTNPIVSGTNCTNSVSGLVTTERMSRTPDERLYGSGDNSSFGFTQCYVSFGDPDGIDFAFTKCNPDGTFTLSGLPDGDWRITIFDQWNDMLVDGLSTPVRIGSATSLCPGTGSSQRVCNMGEIAINQWQANIYTSTFLDLNGNGVRDPGEPGLPLVATNNRFRDGSYSNFNNTDLAGNAGFNEIFPLFSWYVIETDSTRFKSTGAHVVYDAGGPADQNPSCGANGFPPCGSSTIAAHLANTAETIPLPSSLRVPGAYYCTTADCTDAPAPLVPGGNGGSTGRVDPPWVASEGWQGFSGQNSFIEFGKKPFAPGETGGIHGEVIYASTRPFDDPALLIHTSWTPDIPSVKVNLYKESTAPDGSQSLTLVDTTRTSSFDDWAQGFHLAADGVTKIPNMNCPGQGAATGTNADLFFFSLFNQPEWLDLYGSQHGGPTPTPLPNNSQFKCYDGMHNWNQVQPAPYDGMYQFPSVTALDPATGKPTGTNCTGCVTNPDSSDLYRYGTPMLPPGKYVVEVVVPPGYELVKEEDKNILIGDNYIAPVTVQFPGLGSAIYILPDQAEVGASVDSRNWQNGTQNLGRTTLPSHEGDTGSVETFWPCVGAERVVPDYISLFPGSKEVAPFAGATRRLCDRKEVTLDEQTSALAKFWLFTSTHVAAHFTGIITDDYTSEFDPFSPQFGEKFSPPDLPVAIKDWAGNEISRVYADHWGAYNGLTYSTWEVNPPNPTGYAPTMMVTCMNDPGSGPTPDPLFNPEYSQFCYEIPFMPGQTQYMDTPVVPTSAFAGAGYNNVDCAYPDTTPAIAEVDGDGVGPWVGAAGHTLTITALGDQYVPNDAYTGPSATAAPFNAKTVKRHYGFGAAPGTVALVGSDGVPYPLTGVSWSDAAITGTVPAGVPACTMQQQALYGGSAAQCGQLVVTAASGKQSVDTVTVTIGGKGPTHVAASAFIQGAIDAAAPGDLIIVDPTCTAANAAVPCTTAGATKTSSAHNEILLMWKPVRLQGVGAASSIINANAHPAGKLTPWRQAVDCLFGLALNGQPPSASNPFDPTGQVNCPAASATGLAGTGPNGNPWWYFNPTVNNPQVDRIPAEGTVGWDTTVNGNLAEQLQEPGLMGALEGAGITVLSKGVFFPSNPFDTTTTAEASFPTGTVLFTSGNTSTYCSGAYPSNFQCNPSSIDGLGITDSSQGGGGVFVHGWGHNLQIANNRIYNNAGTLSGGISVGQGEYPPNYIQGATTNLPPGSCESGGAGNGGVLPYCHNTYVNVHHNYVSLNMSTGDELFSATPAGAGGVSFCTGADYYRFNYNWVCGNLSTGDGGGLGHLGFSKNGDIEHNEILFNQSTNPTIPTNGGGMIVMGTPDVDPPCSGANDLDCVTPLGTVGPSDGVGPGLVINGNLIQGNAAESGSGGGIAFQHVNGSDVVTFPNTPGQWNDLTVTNNIIANNVAGWDGGGVSLLDALRARIVNNTIVSNVTTATAGVLTNTLGAPLASTQNCPPGGINPATGLCTVAITASAPQPAGLVSINNSATLLANLPATITCPGGGFAPGSTASNGACRYISYPILQNNVIYNNNPYYVGVGALSPQFQQHIVTLFNGFTGTPAPSAPTADSTTADGTGTIVTGGTGACVNRSFWDIGVRGDTGPNSHDSGFSLNPRWSVLSPGVTGYAGSNLTVNPEVQSLYCDGSRQPPEACASAAGGNNNGGCGWAVPPGIADATVPNPIFNLTPVATVDEGNNWINMRWGPLSLTNPTVTGTDGNYGGGPLLGNYALASSSSAIDYIPVAAVGAGSYPTTDFFGNPRPDPTNTTAFDVGAVEFQGTASLITPVLISMTPTSGLRGTTVHVTLTGTGLTEVMSVAVGGSATAINVVVVNDTTVTADIVIPSSITLGNKTVTVSTPTLTSNGLSFRVIGATLSFSAPSPSLTTSTANLTTKNGTITVTNGSGANAAPLTLSADPTISPTATPNGTFSIQPGGTCISGAVVNPGATCTISVRYVPTTTTTSSATVTVTGVGLLNGSATSSAFNAN